MLTTQISLISALAVSLVISLMAVSKNTKIQILIYSLPILITTILVTTDSRIDSLGIIGLAFTSRIPLGCIHTATETRLEYRQSRFKYDHGVCSDWIYSN